MANALVYLLVLMDNIIDQIESTSNDYRLGPHGIKILCYAEDVSAENEDNVNAYFMHSIPKPLDDTT